MMARLPHPWQALACRRVADALAATLLRRVLAGADVLTPRQREVLELRAAGLTLAAIARRIGCTAENVRSVQSRGIQRLAALSAPLLVALALLAVPAAAVTLVEPTVTTAGKPLSAPGNALWACVFTAGPSPTVHWLRPSSPAGGGSHALPTPAQTADLPWTYSARCLNASGWGPEAAGALELRLTVP